MWPIVEFVFKVLIFVIVAMVLGIMFRDVEHHKEESNAKLTQEAAERLRNEWR